MSWHNIDHARKESAHYAILAPDSDTVTLDALKEMFPNGQCDPLNFVLFSTSGIHGSYQTIEEVEQYLAGKGSEEDSNMLTFLVVHPRLVSLRYGNCYPETQDDIEFLKRLRESSKRVILDA